MTERQKEFRRQMKELENEGLVDNQPKRTRSMRKSDAVFPTIVFIILIIVLKFLPTYADKIKLFSSISQNDIASVLVIDNQIIGLSNKITVDSIISTEDFEENYKLIESNIHNKEDILPEHSKLQIDALKSTQLKYLSDLNYKNGNISYNDYLNNTYSASEVFSSLRLSLISILEKYNFKYTILNDGTIHYSYKTVR